LEFPQFPQPVFASRRTGWAPRSTPCQDAPADGEAEIEILRVQYI
jgi:hypothetical protein